MATRLHLNKDELWHALPANQSPMLPKGVTDALVRSGSMFTPSDRENYDKQAHVMFGPGMYRIGRSPVHKTDRRGRQYIERHNLRFGKFGDNPIFHDPTVPPKLYTRPEFEDRSFDYVDVLRAAAETAQQRHDIYLTSTQRQRRRRLTTKHKSGR